MKRRKIKLFASIASFALVAAVATFGIFAATSASVTVSNKVSFTATGISGTICGSISGLAQGSTGTDAAAEKTYYYNTSTGTQYYEYTANTPSAEDLTSGRTTYYTKNATQTTNVEGVVVGGMYNVGAATENKVGVGTWKDDIASVTQPQETAAAHTFGTAEAFAGTWDLSTAGTYIKVTNGETSDIVYSFTVTNTGSQAFNIKVSDIVINNTAVFENNDTAYQPAVTEGDNQHPEVPASYAGKIKTAAIDNFKFEGLKIGEAAQSIVALNGTNATTAPVVAAASTEWGYILSVSASGSITFTLTFSVDDDSTSISALPFGFNIYMAQGINAWTPVEPAGE